MDEDVRQQVLKLSEQLRARGALAKTNVGKAVINSCLLVERTAKLEMRNTTIDTDKVYTRRSVHHSPSVEGEPPAIDTGRLVQSVTHVVEGGGYEPETKGYVGTNLGYGKWLEMGTSKMKPRPWLVPALNANREKIKQLIGESVKFAIHGADVSLDSEGSE